MLFRPRQPKKFLFANIQGVIPKRKSEIAQTVGQTIEKELLTHGDLKKVLQSIDLREPLKPFLEEKIDMLIQKKIAAINPMIMAFIPAEMLNKIKQTILEEIIAAIPEMTEKFGDTLAANISISNLVVENINQFDLARLEKMIVDASNKEFRFIEYLGGIVGVAIGLTQTIISQFILNH